DQRHHQHTRCPYLRPWLHPRPEEHARRDRNIGQIWLARSRQGAPIRHAQMASCSKAYSSPNYIDGIRPIIRSSNVAVEESRRALLKNQTPKKLPGYWSDRLPGYWSDRLPGYWSAGCPAIGLTG